MAKKKSNRWTEWIESNPKLIRIIKKKLLAKDYLKGDKRLMAELEGYLHVPIVIPRRLSSSNKKNVRAVQRAVAELDARQTRVAAIQFSVAKVLQTFARLETLLRNELIAASLITDSMTGPKQRIILGMASPELQMAAVTWEHLEKMVTIVSSRLADSKKACQLQIKLDENARWADKVAP